MFILKKILAALLLPPASLIFPAFLGLWLVVRNRGKQRAAGIALLSISLTALLALSIPALGKKMLARMETLPVPNAEQIARAEAIVVLGGGLYHGAKEYGSDTVSATTLERLRYAARLARQKKLPILVTGGAPEGGIAEAQAMREVLTQEFQVSVKWTESASRDTAENARFSAPQLRSAGIQRILLVSHAWHLPRAVPLFEQEGLTVIPAPTAFSTESAEVWREWLPGDFRYSRIAAHELLGQGANRLRDLF